MAGEGNSTPENVIVEVDSLTDSGRRNSRTEASFVRAKETPQQTADRAKGMDDLMKKLGHKPPPGRTQ